MKMTIITTKITSTSSSSSSKSRLLMSQAHQIRLASIQQQLALLRFRNHSYNCRTHCNDSVVSTKFKLKKENQFLHVHKHTKRHFHRENQTASSQHPSKLLQPSQLITQKYQNTLSSLSSSFNSQNTLHAVSLSNSNRNGIQSNHTSCYSTAVQIPTNVHILNISLYSPYINNHSSFTSFQKRFYHKSYSPYKNENPPQQQQQQQPSSHSSTSNNNTLPMSQQVEQTFFSNQVMGMIIIASLTAAVFLSPTIIDSMKKSTNEYNEVEVEDDVWYQMIDVSKDIQSTVLKYFLNKESPILTNLKNANDNDNNDTNKIANQTANIVADVLNSEALQNALASLISRVVGSTQFQEACQKLLKTLWNDLITDPETTAQVVILLNTAIQNEKIKKSFKELIMGLLQDEEIYKELTGLVVRLGEEKDVLDATKSLLVESAHKALNDPEILDHSMEFATDVVGDDVVQRTSGEALRNTVTYAVRPGLSTLLSIVGLSLIVFSASALGNARTSFREGKEIDAAASVVVKTIGESILNIFQRMVSLPGQALHAIGSTIFGIITLPFKVVGAALSSTLKVGDFTMNMFGNLLSQIAALGPLTMHHLRLFASSVHTFVCALPQNLMEFSRAGIVSLLTTILNKSKVFGTLAVNTMVTWTSRLYSSVVAFLVANMSTWRCTLNSISMGVTTNLYSTLCSLWMSAKQVPGPIIRSLHSEIVRLFSYLTYMLRAAFQKRKNDGTE